MVQPIPPALIQAFFADYAARLMSYDGGQVVQCYGIPFLMLADEQAAAFTEPATLQGVFAQAANMYQGHGFARAVPKIGATHQISSRIIQVRVNWEYFNTEDHPLYNCDYEYLLRQDGEQLKIYSAISINEPERMAEWLGRSSG